MRVAIIEDDFYWMKQIENEILAIESNAQIKQYVSGENFLEENESFDVVVFDIELSEGQMDGLTCCKIYKERYPEMDYIALIATNHMEFGREGYISRAFRYIDKSRLKEELKEAFQGASQVLQNREVILIRPVKQDAMKVLIRDIYAVITEMRGRVHVVTDQEQIEVTDKFGSICEMIKPYGFYKIHRGVVVNMKYVNQINEKYVTLYGIKERRFELSRRNRKEFLNAFIEWRRERASR